MANEYEKKMRKFVLEHRRYRYRCTEFLGNETLNKSWDINEGSGLTIYYTKRRDSPIVLYYFTRRTFIVGLRTFSNHCKHINYESFYAVLGQSCVRKKVCEELAFKITPRVAITQNP